MHKSATSGFSTRESLKNPLAKSRDFAKAEFDTQLHSNLSPNPRSSYHLSEKYGPNKTSPLKVSFKSDVFPSFNEENIKRSYASPKSHFSSDYNGSTMNRNSSEHQKPLVDESLFKVNPDALSTLGRGNQSARASGAKDLKFSNSYINAMKALQIKVKSLEEQMKKEKLELEDKHRREIDHLQNEFEQEKRALLNLQADLKNQFRMSEENVRQKERIIENMNDENERLRQIGIEVEQDRLMEVQKLVNDKKRLNDQYLELEQKYQERLLADESLKSRNIQAQYTIKDRENEIADLREKISAVEKEKVNLNGQFEQKLKDLVAKNKQGEEKRRELEEQFQDEARKRIHREEDYERELSQIKGFISQLEDRGFKNERRIKEKEEEVLDANAQVAKLHNEIENLHKEIQKLKSEGDRTHAYAQDMAQMNQRLLNNMAQKGKANDNVTFDLGQRYHTEEVRPFEDSLENNSRPFDIKNQRRGSITESIYRSPRTAAETNSINSRGKGWSVASPKQRNEIMIEGEQAKGTKLTEKDLLASEKVGRCPVEERRSPKGILVRGGNASSTNLARGSFVESTAEKKGRSARKETKEEALDRLELERVIREIIEIQKEMLGWNKEYQILSGNLNGLERDSADYHNKRRKMEEIGALIQDRSFQLIQLKQKEEELGQRLKI